MLPPIDVNAAGFSLSNAKAFAEASRLAYELPPTIQSPINHILVLEGDDYVLFVFRGTKEPADFVTDARCWFRNDATKFTGKIHAGFDTAFTSTVLGLSEALTRVSPSKRIYFAGHSLGGAQAALAGYYFGPHYPGAQVYTFG